jgi:hypothetical protein
MVRKRCCLLECTPVVHVCWARAGVCAPTYGFAFNPFLYGITGALSTTVVSAAGGTGVLRPVRSSLVARVLAVLVPGRLAQPPLPAPPAPPAMPAPAPAQSTADGASNVSVVLDRALDAFFAAQRCPVPTGPGSELAAALDALAPRCAAAAPAELCGSCIAAAEAALLHAAWRALPSLPPGALSDTATQAACGRAVVDGLAARSVQAATLRKAGQMCGDFAGRPRCDAPELAAAVQPYLASCRDALAEAVSGAAPRGGMTASAFNATARGYCARCYWPALALVLNTAPFSDAFWCRVAPMLGAAAGSSDAAFFAALLQEPAFAACMADVQAQTRRALAADVLVDPRAKAYQARCWDDQTAGGTELLSAATRTRIARLRCAAAAPQAGR